MLESNEQYPQELAEEISYDIALDEKPSWQLPRYATNTHLSLADGLLLLIALLGASMLFFNLGALPLSEGEANNALNSWQVWQPEPLTTSVPSSAIYVTLTSVATQLAGSSDGMMRLIPALSGLLLILTPWFMRHRLGPAGTLVVSFLIAVSPALTIAARTANGQSIGMLALAWLFLGWVRYQEGDGDKWLLIAAAALAVGLSSGPVFYTGAVTFGISWLLISRAGPFPFDALRQPERELLIRAGIMAGVLFVIANAFFMLYPAGTMLSDWLLQFTIPTDIFGWLNPLLAMGRYEPVMLVLGGIAIIWATVRGYAFPSWLIYWFAAGLLLTLLQGDTVSNVLVLTIPSYWLIGFLAQRLLDKPFHPNMHLFALSTIVLLSIAFINVSRHSRVALTDPASFRYLVVAIGATVIAISILIFAYGIHPSITFQSGFVALFLLFVFYGWGTAWWMGQAGANDPRERWVTDATDPDVQQLKMVIDDIADQTVGRSRSADLFVAVDNPAVRWYLRDYEAIELGNSVPGNASNELIVALESVETPFAQDYSGTSFAIRRTRMPEAEQSGAVPTDLMRWWLFHDTQETIVQERAILWVRADLLQP